LGIESWDQIFTPERLISIGQGLLRLVVVFVLTRLSVSLSAFAVDRSLAQYRRRLGAHGRESRAQTVAALLKSVSRYLLYFVGLIWALDAVGIRATSVLTAAGIGGLAVGFGAQHLVRDVISGFFILFEDQYQVGEYVTLNGATGVVDEVGLRSTRVRAFAGEVYYVPNGSIELVTNHSRGNMRAWVEIGIAYEADHNRAIAVAAEACEKLKENLEIIMEGPKVMGIQKFGESDVVLSIWAMARNMKQWELEREIRRAVKEAFEREGIEVPYPRRVILQPGHRGRAETGGRGAPEARQPGGGGGRGGGGGDGGRGGGGQGSAGREGAPSEETW
jgi:small conductance mechanosensitive channel